VFQEEFGVAPVEYAQTQRLLLAKRLLTDTALPVIEVAMASGFASLRRFNDLFSTRYRMTPGELRRTAASATPASMLSFDLAYRPPYDWDAMLEFLGRRAIAGVEAIDRRTYLRTVRVCAREEHSGWISVAPSPRRAALRVGVSASLAGALPVTLARVKHLFDLSSDPGEIGAALGPLAAGHPGLRVPGAMDGFEIAVRAILGQQVTVLAATRIAARFAEAFGDPLDKPHASLRLLFPRAATIAALDPVAVARNGVVRTRARAIVELARESASGRLRLDPSADVDATIAALDALPGVGPWTAQYVAMRALGWPDAFPHPDVAVLKAMKHTRAAVALAAAEAWRPWRSYAVLHLWKSLENPQ
jgi:AraC family transcriptional regulator, regulatory protein of adaptative response / DNA-3-methyladenine glycosylase II